MRLLLLPLSFAACLMLGANPAAAERIFGLTTQNGIVVFDSNLPTVATGGGTVTGLAPNESLVALDYQPLSGNVILLGSLSNLYTLSDLSGNSFNVTPLGSTLSPTLAGTNFAFDFNPSLSGGQFARIISDTDNNRVIDGFNGGYLGTVEKTPVFYATGDANEGVDPNIAGIAYDTNIANAPSTQQYGVDASLGTLTTVANNAGTLNTVGSLGLLAPITNEIGFDISGASGAAFASIQTGLVSDLYTIDLATGAASLVGPIGSLDVIRDITVAPVPEPASIVALLGIVGLGLGTRRRDR